MIEPKPGDSINMLVDKINKALGSLDERIKAIESAKQPKDKVTKDGSKKGQGKA